MSVVNETFYEWLTAEIDRQYPSRTDFARAAGVSPSLVSRIFGGDRNATADFCLGAARALHADPIEVLRMAGHLPPSIEQKPQHDEYLDRGVAYLERIGGAAERSAALRMLSSLAGTGETAPTVSPSFQPSHNGDDLGAGKEEGEYEVAGGRGLGGDESRSVNQDISQLFDDLLDVLLDLAPISGEERRRRFMEAVQRHRPRKRKMDEEPGQERPSGCRFPEGTDHQMGYAE